MAESFFIIQQSTFEVLDRIRVGFEEEWKDLALEVHLVRHHELDPEKVRDPQCMGCAGFALEAELTRDMPEEKVLLELSNRLEPIPGILRLVVDDEEIGRLAAQHLLTQGVQNACALYCQDMRYSLTRVNAFRHHLLENGVKSDQVELRNITYRTLTGKYAEDQAELRSQFQRVATSLMPGSVVFAANDTLAAMLLRFNGGVDWLLAHGFSVVGVDDLYGPNPNRGECPIPLSTVLPPFPRLGRAAAQWVAEILRKGQCRPAEAHRVLAGARVITRSSSVSLQSRDPLVQRFLQLASECIALGESPRVSELNRKLKTSDRTLYHRIRKSLGMSPKQALLSLALHESSRLLLETELSMTEIAYSLGFYSPSAFSAQFKAFFSVTPREYRQKRSKQDVAEI